VPTGAASLAVATAGASADLTLYLRRGSAPTVSIYDYRAQTADHDESLAVTHESSPVALTAGDWFVGIGATSAATFSVTATLGTDATCALWCDAVAPAVAGVGAEVTLEASPQLAGCSGQAGYDWDFGDGSPHAGGSTAAHAWDADGVYTWVLTVTADGRSCVTSGTIVVGEPAQCAVSCEAAVPAAGTAGTELSFAGSASASACSGALAYDWDFGDGSAHAATAAASHAYAAAGSYSWTFTASSDGQSCSRSGSVSVAAPAQPFRAVVPSVAHAPGAQGTQWRSDVAAVNRSDTPAFVTLSYFPDSGAGSSRDLSLPAGAAAEWRDVLVSQLGLAPSAASKGTLHVLSSSPLVVTSRTYNQTPSGTFGQYYPALQASAALSPSTPGVIAQIKKNDAFRTNIGVVNLGSAPCTVAVQLLDAAGAPIGSLKRLTVDPGRWKQQDDFFKNVGAGSHDTACATVRVETPGGLAWAYASVVDNATGDPTTFPVIPAPESPAQASGPMHMPPRM